MNLLKIILSTSAFAIASVALHAQLPTKVESLGMCGSPPALSNMQRIWISVICWEWTPIVCWLLI